METKEEPVVEPAPIRETAEGHSPQDAVAAMPVVRTRIARRCEDCRVENAFHGSRSQRLNPSFNTSISFTGIVNIPAGRRAVIELVTATIQVPSGEGARLRLFTSLDSAPSNLDFVLTPQGQTGGRDILVATHSVRVYSDNLISFNVNRDNAVTEGDAFICISGYFVDV